jgi:hypothetical protein
MYSLSHVKKSISLAFPGLRDIYSGARRKKRRLIKDFKQAMSNDHCAVYINWNSPPLRWDSIAKLHWCAARAIWRERKLYAFLSALVWPVKSIILSAKITRQHGPHISRKTGLSLNRQFSEQIYLAIRHFIAPRAYYFYGLYDADRRRAARFYVQDHEIGHLTKLTNQNADYMNFEDKRRFIASCERFGLPVIPIVAEFEKGAWNSVDGGLDKLPENDLFAKPALGKCANGVLMYQYLRPGLYRCNDGTLKTEENLMNALAEISLKHPYILQKRYFNHPEIAAFSAGALCTSRVVTCRLPDGRCEVITAIFKMPTRNNFADNFSIGGIAISLDKNSGILGSALTKDLDADRIDHHPDSGLRIAGFRLPHWQEAVQLCLKAHAAFPGYAFVGWDVAVTADGPVLVEGNLQWGVESLQRAHYQPLGKTDFTENVLSHVSHLRCFNPSLKSDFWST